MKITVRFYGIAYDNTMIREWHSGLNEGANIGTLLRKVIEKFPKLSNLVYDEAGNHRDYFSISINNVDIQGLEGWDTPLSDGDIVFVMPPIGGG